MKLYLQGLWLMTVIIVSILLGYYKLPQYAYNEFPIWQIIPVVIEVFIWFFGMAFINDYRPKKRQSSCFWR